MVVPAGGAGVDHAGGGPDLQMAALALHDAAGQQVAAAERREA